MVDGTTYSFIEDKIKAMRDAYPSLRNRSSEYVFSALCVKANFYKNPAYLLDEQDFDNMIVDGSRDGGVDIILSDPASDGCDMILAQSKFYKDTITKEDVSNAMNKLADFLLDMRGHRYDGLQEHVVRQYLSASAELGDESHIKLVFYTSALKARIPVEKIRQRISERFPAESNLDVEFYFGPDIVEEIKELESRRPDVIAGKLRIDQADNYLEYGDDEAIIVNVSALSLKELYAVHSTSLLSKNLRYHVANKNIDHAISNTIANASDTFWLKNNGITIVCEDYCVDGREVKLSHFSIINGGQTTYMIYRSPYVTEENDFYLPCKIVRLIGNTSDEKNQFSLDIAKAVNSQKPIKDIDLKANMPEQIRFAQSMRDVGIFYQTKRGENVLKQYNEPYLHTDLAEIGKLCLAGIFQLPCTGRNKFSVFWEDRYYNPIFKMNQSEVAKICRELLYMNYYFNKTFKPGYEKYIRARVPNADGYILFMNVSRMICLSFATLVGRKLQGNITTDSLSCMTVGAADSVDIDGIYRVFSDIAGLNGIFPFEIFSDKNIYDALLFDIFNYIVKIGYTQYRADSRINENLSKPLTESNYLKRDVSYYSILSNSWLNIAEQIEYWEKKYSIVYS